MVEFLAVGGGTLLLFPLAWLLRHSVGLDTAEYAVGFTMFHAAHFINDPHFSVTYLLFYGDARQRLVDVKLSRAQRTRYWVAGVVVPLLLGVWAACALMFRAATMLGWMIELMFLLVGWHYVKQGFGVLTVLSARRGVSFDAPDRIVILTHCFAAWAFAWSNPARGSGEFEEKGVTYWSVAHPAWFEILTALILFVSTIALVVTLWRKWRRDGSLPWTPLVSFLVTIWLWTIYTSVDPLMRYVIPALHSIQYLYFVWLMKRNEARAKEAAPTFGPPVATKISMLAGGALLLGWFLFRGAPAVMDASIDLGLTSQSSLGTTPFFAAFFVVVNIHHYFMDYVIWRRDNPTTKYLQHDVAT